MTNSQRTHWQTHDVVDVRDAAFCARTYIEQADVRTMLAQVVGTNRFEAACEVGSGYGRMTVVLAEFSKRVIGMERESGFVAESTRLFPCIQFLQLESLTSLPAADNAFDIVLTFTVLQHLTDAVLSAAAEEIRRIMKPGGYFLICEETDPSINTIIGNGICTKGRTVATYTSFFAPLHLVTTKPRRVEPTYHRANVGTYMLFGK